MRVVVLGASKKPERFSNKAIRLLDKYGHTVLPVHPVFAEIEGFTVYKHLKDIDADIDTVTMYVNPQQSQGLGEDIISLSPGRVIFNPGTESDKLESELNQAGIDCVRDCTLVMLQQDRF